MGFAAACSHYLLKCHRQVTVFAVLAINLTEASRGARRGFFFALANTSHETAPHNSSDRIYRHE